LRPRKPGKRCGLAPGILRTSDVARRQSALSTVLRPATQAATTSGAEN
jgi:hypothetical protein